MIAADTSSLVAYFNGKSGADVERIAAAFATGELVLPPVVVTEILSDPIGSPAIDEQVREIPTLDIADDYWARAGESRRLLLSKGFKARVADALIAQSCIDQNVALIARDQDFRHFAKHCGLSLA